MLLLAGGELMTPRPRVFVLRLWGTGPARGRRRGTRTRTGRRTKKLVRGEAEGRKRSKGLIGGQAEEREER